MATNWIYSILIAAAISVHVSESFKKYNEQTEFCCNGAVSRKLNTQQRCCGALAYSPEDHLCCDQTLYPVPATNDSQWACCYPWADSNVTTTNASETQVYNARTHQCCSGKVLEKPEVGKMYECCEGTLYTARTQRCCGKKVIKLEQGFDCCGNAEVYDTLTKTCCRTAAVMVGSRIHVPYQLHDKDGVRKCCGLELYDASANYCCNQTVFPLPEDVLEKDDHNDRCCGTELKPTNLSHPLCHHGHWWERNSTDMHVCAGQLFNFNLSICCGNQTLMRTSGLSCCWSAEMPYDQKTQACCGTEVVPLSKEDLESGTISCCSQWHH